MTSTLARAGSRIHTPNVEWRARRPLRTLVTSDTNGRGLMTHLRRADLFLAGIVVTCLSLGGVLPAAASTVVRDPPGGAPLTPMAPAVRTVVVGGMPGWQVALIALAAALVAAALAVLADRTRNTRSRSAVS